MDPQSHNQVRCQRSPQAQTMVPARTRAAPLRRAHPPRAIGGHKTKSPTSGMTPAYEGTVAAGTAVNPVELEPTEQ